MIRITLDETQITDIIKEYYTNKHNLDFNHDDIISLRVYQSAIFAEINYNGY